MNIFDATARHDCSPCAHGESTFQFLNRVDSQPFAAVRDELQRWLDRVPTDAQPDLRSRLRSHLERHFLAAFWELYLHEVFHRLGFEVVLHPNITSTKARPDFLMHGAEGSCYLEAKVLFASDLGSAAARHEETIRDTLDRVHTENFTLCLRVLSRGGSPLAVARHRPAIEKWLAALDPDDVHDCLIDVEHDEEIGARVGSDLRFDIVDAGWHLRLEPIPRVPDGRGMPGRAIGIFWPYDDDEPIDDITPLRRALERKAGHYGTLDYPLVVAVLIDASFSEDNDVEAALYGTRAISYTERLRPTDQARARWVRLADGLYRDERGPRRRDLSAVLSAHGLQPSSVASSEFAGIVTWHHPWALRPLSARLPFASRDLDGSTGHLHAHPATVPAHALLGLPADWPGFSGNAALPTPDW